MINSIGYQAGLKARAPISASKAPEDPHRVQHGDHFISDHNAEALKVGTEFGLMTSALFGAPALLGATLGGWGVAASVLAFGALATQAEDTSEYPGSNSGGLASSALLGGFCAAVGAAAGLAGVAACAAVGIGLGGLVTYITWDHDSKKQEK